ncbi:MAG TPA: NAD(P)H-dependent glycerol-3-phosphate dehydrogenase [Woeseiaceae bacterium]|nr:NAD(P)H-dependent glycerol-3-phosphate dehydrogenase [Woeseiaceae bacterium]
MNAASPGGPRAPAADAPAIAVVGAGSWGTALAVQLARSGRQVRLWGRDAVQLRAAAADRENRRYLPGVPLAGNIRVDEELADAIEGAGDILLAVPSRGLRETITKLQPLMHGGERICWATKGFELTTGKLPHEVVRELLGDDHAVAVLSGPTFAREVAEGLPTALTIAASDETFASDLARALSGPNFRAYTSSDIAGVEVGGAVKNVLAIGAGISDGLGFGANARIALINRGLAEMIRLGVALGAKQDTFVGLAGMGDLVLTCTDDQSRNRRFGLALASGQTVEEAEAGIHQVVEGVRAAKAVHQVSTRLGVEMPICEQVYRILYEGVAPRDAVEALMNRELKAE